MDNIFTDPNPDSPVKSVRSTKNFPKPSRKEKVSSSGLNEGVVSQSDSENSEYLHNQDNQKNHENLQKSTQDPVQHPQNSQNLLKNYRNSQNKKPQTSPHNPKPNETLQNHPRTRFPSLILFFLLTFIPALAILGYCSESDCSAVNQKISHLSVSSLKIQK